MFCVEAQNFVLGMICQSEHHWAFKTWCQKYVFYLHSIRCSCGDFFLLPLFVATLVRIRR